MRKRLVSLRLGALAIGFCLAATFPVAAAQIEISVTNNQPDGGFALAPVWLGVQDGSFNAFTPGTTASSQIARLAQFGDTSLLSSQFEAAGVGVDTTLTSGNAIKQFLPGQSNSTILDIASPATDRYFSFAGMVVPSNDFFLGNATPLQIFNADGSFKGPMTILVFGSNLWDSDTEAQSTTTALTFIVGQTPGTGTQITDGTITTVLPDSAAFLASINGLTTVAGYTITNIPTSDQLVATIRINAVPEPSAVVLFGTGLVGCLLAVYRNRRRGRSDPAGMRRMA